MKMAMCERTERKGANAHAGTVPRHCRRRGRGHGVFGRDESGSLVVFALFVFMAMLLVGGMALDLVRYETHRARLQSTLDRAVLAAASLNQELSPEEVVLDYFDRADLGAYIGADDITATASLTSRRVSASADMDMPTTFMRMLGITDMQTPAAGTAEESATRTEVSLVVDVSGSMGWWSYSGGRSKIDLLRLAAIQFVNILMCDPSDPDATTDCTVEPDTVSITLVPYAQQVLAGESVLDQLTVTEEHEYSSCITFDEEDFASAAIDPATLYKRTGHFDAWYWSSPVWWECSTDAWRRILPVENEPQDLRDAIIDLQASGNTSIDLGMKWGAAFLDPAFQPVIQGLVEEGVVAEAFDDRPFSYSENGIKKVIVLMTDGVNTTQYYLNEGYRSGPSGVYYNTVYPDRVSIYRPSTDMFYWPHTGTWEDHPYGAGSSYSCSGWWWWSCSWQNEPGSAVEYSFPDLWANHTIDWYEQFWWLGTPVSSNGGWTKDMQLDAICSAAKAQNITVYTIGFEVTTASAAVMQSCASSPAHYFDVDGADLTDAFAAIARQISALRLVN